MPQVKPEIETFAKIKVVGVGGAGGSAVDRMVRSGIRGVEFIAMNTDVQALHHNGAQTKLHIGKTVTRGLGAGMNPDVGRRSAEESQNEIREIFKDTDMVFITCGLGGGTGSGASPIIAEIAREMGALTVAVVTRPFSFEGPQRMRIAEEAYQELAQHVDTIITIPNDRILQIIDKKTSLIDSFRTIDDILHKGVQGISELITVPGLINVDFADVKTIMQDTGSALMGIGVSSGESRAIDAAQAAISSPLLEISIDGARGILLLITGGSSLAMQEVAEAAKIVTSSADENARVIFGAVIDEKMGEEVRVTVIATGFEDREIARQQKIAPPPIDEPTSSFGFKKARPSSGGLFAKKREPFVQRPAPQQFHAPQEPIVDTSEDDDFFGSSQEERRPQFSSRDSVRQQPPASARRPSAPQVTDQEDDNLEIPTFIRKKMDI